jgi:hypothetical protein
MALESNDRPPWEIQDIFPRISLCTLFFFFGVCFSSYS